MFIEHSDPTATQLLDMGDEVWSFTSTVMVFDSR
jgi:hypothetical protein